MADDGQGQTLESSLERLQERYRQQSLESQLEAVAGDLRNIKLQLVIMEEMFGISVSVDSTLVEQVKKARGNIRREDYDALESEIESLESRASDERASVEQSLSKQLVSYNNQVDAMVRINEKTEAYDQEKLGALQDLLENWNWRNATSVGSLTTFEAQIEECRTFGKDMSVVYEDARTEIIDPLADEGIKDIVDSILESDTVYLTDLEPEERERLVSSDLGEYLALSLA